MNNNNNKSFFDSKTILAVVLVFAFLFIWEDYIAKKYRMTPTETVSNKQVPSVEDRNEKVEAAPAVTIDKTILLEDAAQVREEKLLNYENKKISFQISSIGMGLKNIVLKDHFDRDNKPMKMGASDKMSLFEISVLNSSQPLEFVLSQKGENIFEGVATVGATRITRVLEINPETEAIKSSVFLMGKLSDFRGLSVSISEKTIIHSEGGWLAPSFENQEVTVIHSGKEERINSSAATEKIEKDFAQVSLAAVGSQYFVAAMVDKSVIAPEVRVIAGKDQADVSAVLNYKVNSSVENLELNWISYVGAKALLNLEKIDKDLAKTVNLGFFAQIGRVLLIILKWFYGLFGNWGVAIILLTLLVRVLVLPLNVSTFRSTKKMQKLQPLIASLRERYKDDKAAMNREMMALWKEHKVNPIGGCLPMLLQLPIFFALYQVLGQSIELYQAPFVAWIHDLSLKDPYYVLPALMGICMFVQQKITPTTMDPAQAKVMLFLPIVFSFMMISLPAGLTLYIFVNTLSGILLQQLFMHDRKTVTAANTVKA